MEAIRVARAATGRNVLVKAEGAYHGHHDLVMISVAPGPGDLRRRPPVRGRVAVAGLAGRARSPRASRRRFPGRSWSCRSTTSLPWSRC